MTKPSASTSGEFPEADASAGSGAVEMKSMAIQVNEWINLE
jgi:hypothetical protein